MSEVWKGKAYKLTDSKNFDKYLKVFGVGFIQRKLVNSITTTIELKKDGDLYTLVTSTKFGPLTISFKLDEEFVERIADGRQLKSIITMDGNKMIHKQLSDPPATIIREFDENDLVETMTIGDVVCVRKYAVQK
ncbi:fatty acid-binding protein, muscle-like [Contarinia nasturtii]|uniref:fatty acid-binding protein, muscle-like n=1 Tax=Contarinia nasturtii TaxID=265458 RepID=UPI0012D3F0B5|nr:fatty acid-binding protein, muscle-like [Contarinia nasturtii]